MMVTFVSQCEKNALKKTRRVLDAFANRIGDNTWQTLITEEGLETVKRMLRKTASRSTAVSCHWIRSRSRSQFLWVVGNKNKFNSEGVVPVNYTEVNDIKTDENSMLNSVIYANTKKQLLAEHLFAVGYLAKTLVNLLVQDVTLSNTAFLAGVFHDLGKIDPNFQEYLAKELTKKTPEEQSDDGQHIEKTSHSFEKYPTHNELSWLMLKMLADGRRFGLNGPQFEFLEHAVFWHHAKPIRKDEFDSFGKLQEKFQKSIQQPMSDVLVLGRQLLSSVNKLVEQYGAAQAISNFDENPDQDVLFSLRRSSVPSYKNYTSSSDDFREYSLEAKLNAKANIIRTCLITADRKISSLSAEQLIEAIKNKKLEQIASELLAIEQHLNSQIEQCLSGFEQRFPNSDRNKAQTIAAKQLAERTQVVVLNGPAGCGKTKIALEWAKNTEAKQIIWICPRVQVCQGLYNELTSEEYLPNSQIEICTGEYKLLKYKGVEQKLAEHQIFSGDVVLTTIDQVLNAALTHTKATGLVDYLNAHVVFDEYHEYIQMPGFNLLFAELVECKKAQKLARTLLVSATPNYCFIKDLLGIQPEEIINVEAFNTSLYKFEFVPFSDDMTESEHPLYKLQPKCSFIISNTAYTAQMSFIANQQQEKAVLLHSKFMVSDKREIFDSVFASFKRNGSKAFDILRSGPIVQASLNITCETMTTEFTMAENWLQRLGRLDRFGENSKVNLLTTAIPEHIVEGKGNSACARFLSRLNALESAKAWYEFLQDNLPNQPVKLAEIYRIYKDFYESELVREKVQQDLIKGLKKGIQIIESKVHDPKRIKTSKQEKSKKLKRSSLRGDSRYVQLALCQIFSPKHIHFLNEYACDSAEKLFTLSVDEIEGHDPSGDKNLLAFMHQKHHKFMQAKGESYKKEFKSYLLKDKAVEPDMPIYLSYTQEDLNLCNDSAHPHAIYYAQGKHQPIGAISINRLNQQFNNEE